MEPPVGHVVHLESALHMQPPAQLRLPRRLGAAAKTVIGVLLVAELGIAVAGIGMLWITQTPGWWFSVLFTVMLGGFTLGVWAAYLISFGTAAQGRRAEAAWAARGPIAFQDGRVVDRKVGLSDTGRVSGFDLTVELPDGAVLAAWRPTPEEDGLLQPQVPGVGAPARVWRTDGALVAEVVDPTVVPS